MKRFKIWDIVNNNPRADRQHTNWKEKEEDEKFNNDMMLYDDMRKTNSRLELIRRMVRAYNKNVEKANKNSNSALSAAEKRARKLEDLLTRWYSWKNLQ